MLKFGILDQIDSECSEHVVEMLSQVFTSIEFETARDNLDPNLEFQALVAN